METISVNKPRKKKSVRMLQQLFSKAKARYSFYLFSL